MDSMKKENKEQKPPAKQSKSPIVLYVIIFIVGFLTGVAFTVYKSDPPASQIASSGDESDHNHPEDNETEKAILNLEAEVTKDPKNHQAWTRLGHLYYDSQRPQKAIGAYAQSLELMPGDANVLTDLGVMYRRSNQPQKAIESFNQAIASDSSHQPARFNKGIVLLFDLNQPDEAIASWEDILVINPDAKTADGSPLREFIEKVKADLNTQN